MRRCAFIILAALVGQSIHAQSLFRLAPPLMKYETIFFSHSIQLQILFDQAGTVVHYTLNGDEATEKSFIYKEPIVIKNRLSTVKARSFAENHLTSSDDFLPSESVQVTFIKDGYKIKQVNCTDPDKKYHANGSASFADNKGGISSVTAPTWLGFQNDTVTVELTLEQPKKINEVLLNFLQNEEGWIFLPKQVSIYSYDNKFKNFVPFAEEIWSHDVPSPGNQCVYKIIKTKKEPVISNKLLLKIFTVDKIPDWHAAKGTHAWLFIDEIKVY